MSWGELIAAADQPDEALSPAARVLLLQPAAGDTDIPNEASTMLAKAATSVGAVRQQQTVATELLGRRRYWSPCDWTTTADGLVCTGPHSYRQPGAGLTQQDLRLVASAFAGSGTGRASAAGERR